MCKQHPTKQGIFLTRHHLKTKERGGHGNPQNILRLWNDKHRNWHFVFRDRNLVEIIQQIHMFYQQCGSHQAWKSLFKDMELWEVRILLNRVHQIKTGLKRKPKHLNHFYFVETKVNKNSEHY